MRHLLRLATAVAVPSLLYLSLFSLTACIFTRPVYTESRRPILPFPTLAPLAEIPNTLPADDAAAQTAYANAALNTVRLIEYAEALEKIMDEYNRVSEEKNKTNGYSQEKEPATP